MFAPPVGQAQALMLLKDWDAAPDARFAARIQAVLAAGEMQRDGVHKVRAFAL
jgi:hypothetical protein